MYQSTPNGLKRAPKHFLEEQFRPWHLVNPDPEVNIMKASLRLIFVLLLLHIVFVLIAQKYRVPGAVGVSYKPNLKMLLLLSHTAQCKLWARTTLSGILTPLSWHAIGDQINGLCKTLWVIQHSAFRHMIEWYMSVCVWTWTCLSFLCGYSCFAKDS